MGLLAPTTRREVVETLVPANGPVMRKSGFSGAQGSTPGGTYSHRYRNSRPLPPTYSAAQSVFSGSTVAHCAVMSMRSTSPV